MDDNLKIPKIIHYCWFGKKRLPAKAVRCIKSWKQYCPDYEIVQWNEDNFDITSCDYSKEAYEAGKYAFVSDYARFKILYEYGGIYFDTDVELIRTIDHIIDAGPFMGCENNDINGIHVAPGLGMGSFKGNDLIKCLMDGYVLRHFINSDGSCNQKTIVEYTTELLNDYGLKNQTEIQEVEDFLIYPKDYFAPQNPLTGKLAITDKTVSIHHYDSSWYTPYQKFADRMSHVLGNDVTSKIIEVKKTLKRQIKTR